MVSLKDYLKFWNDIAEDVDEISGMLPVTVDEEMGRRIQALPRGSLTLFVLPPVADSKLSAHDSFVEENDCVVFLMGRYDPQRMQAVEMLADVQPVMERVKGLLLERMRGCCSIFELNVKSLTTMPETKFYAGFAGWSLGYKVFTT